MQTYFKILCYVFFNLLSNIFSIVSIPIPFLNKTLYDLITMGKNPTNNGKTINNNK